jgi:hypothetical protein
LPPAQPAPRSVMSRRMTVIAAQSVRRCQAPFDSRHRPGRQITSLQGCRDLRHMPAATSPKIRSFEHPGQALAGVATISLLHERGMGPQRPPRWLSGAQQGGAGVPTVGALGIAAPRPVQCCAGPGYLSGEATTCPARCDHKVSRPDASTTRLAPPLNDLAPRFAPQRRWTPDGDASRRCSMPCFRRPGSGSSAPPFRHRE